MYSWSGQRANLLANLYSAFWKTPCADFWSDWGKQWRLTAFCNFGLMTWSSDLQTKLHKMNFIFFHCHIISRKFPCCIFILVPKLLPKIMPVVYVIIGAASQNYSVSVVIIARKQVSEQYLLNGGLFWKHETETVPTSHSTHYFLTLLGGVQRIPNINYRSSFSFLEHDNIVRPNSLVNITIRVRERLWYQHHKILSTGSQGNTCLQSWRSISQYIYIS